MLTSTFCPYSKPFTCSASPTTFGATSTKIPDFILFLTIPSTISPSLNFKIFCSNVPCNSLYDNSILPVSLSYFFTTTFILWPTCRISAAFCINISEIFSSLNMIGIVGKNIKAIIPREESSSIVGDDGLVEEKHIVNKKGKILHVCIKEIIQNDDEIELIVSKKILELKVRKWMYMHLKPGMKLKGVVVSTNDYAAFVDVGGGEDEGPTDSEDPNYDPWNPDNW